MTIKIGFDFDEFGGNVDIVIIEGNKAELAESTYLKSLAENWQLEQSDGQEWSFFNGTDYPPEGAETLAKELSEEFSTKTIYFYFGDASGWMGYTLFIDGESAEEYSFGESYEEEMAEMGVSIEDTRKEGTVVTTDEDEQQFIFWSQMRSLTEHEICGGEAFIDEFLQLYRAYIGWSLFPNS